MHRKFLRAVGFFAVYTSMAAIGLLLIFGIMVLIASADAATELAVMAEYLGLSFGTLVTGEVILLLVDIADAVAPVAGATKETPIIEEREKAA